MADESYMDGRHAMTGDKAHPPSPTTHPAFEIVYPLRRAKDGALTPFPTIYWLTDPALDKALADLERRGAIAELEALLGGDETLMRRYHDDHRRYVDRRWMMLTPDDRAAVEASDSLARAFAGGVAGIADFSTVKCLHAHVAHHLADRNTVAELLIERYRLAL